MSIVDLKGTECFDHSVVDLNLLILKLLDACFREVYVKNSDDLAQDLNVSL